MKKIKIFRDYDYFALEQEVNHFISTHRVVTNIQYQFSCTNHTPYSSVMIVYEE